MTNNVTLGALGESIVFNHFNGSIKSDDYWDKDKDGNLPNGDDAEVKCQNRWRSEHSFTVPMPHKGKHNNQLRKCLEVKRLFFVEYDVQPRTNTVRIWECTDRRYLIRQTLRGPQAIFDINKMTLVHEFDDAEMANRMFELSQAAK
jgi:hypothetical protein